MSPERQFQSRDLSGSPLFTILDLGAQEASHDVPNFRVLTSGSPARIGAKSLPELRMPRRLAISDLVVGRAEFALLSGRRFGSLWRGNISNNDLAWAVSLGDELLKLQPNRARSFAPRHF